MVDCANSSVRFSAVEVSLGQCFTRPNIGLLRILKKVGMNHLMTLWKCLLLERHVLVNLYRLRCSA